MNFAYYYATGEPIQRPGLLKMVKMIIHVIFLEQFLLHFQRIRTIIATHNKIIKFVLQSFIINIYYKVLLSFAFQF